MVWLRQRPVHAAVEPTRTAPLAPLPFARPLAGLPLADEGRPSDRPHCGRRRVPRATCAAAPVAARDHPCHAGPRRDARLHPRHAGALRRLLVEPLLRPVRPVPLLRHRDVRIDVFFDKGANFRRLILDLVRSILKQIYKTNTSFHRSKPTFGFMKNDHPLPLESVNSE